MDRRMQIQLFLRGAISRPCMQPLWRVLLKLSHAGMNAGGGHSVALCVFYKREERSHWFAVEAHISVSF
jgi:hypothetical protein